MGGSEKKKEVEVEKRKKEEKIVKEMKEKPNNKMEIKLESEEKSPEKIIEGLKAKIEEQEDRYLRLVAEFDNYKKRNARLYNSMVQSARESLISSLLEVVDNFERALESTEKSDIDSIKEGTKLIYQQLNELLKKEGVEPIEAVGKEFNPNLHEAVMQVESDEHPEGIIVGELTRGYKGKDKVLRFSKVTVSKGADNKKENNSKNGKEDI